MMRALGRWGAGGCSESLSRLALGLTSRFLLRYFWIMYHMADYVAMLISVWITLGYAYIISSNGK